MFLIATISTLFLTTCADNIIFDPLDPIREHAVMLVNSYRRRHENTSDITYDEELESAFTQKWADQLIQGSELIHSSFSGIGENIAFMYDYSPFDAIDQAVAAFYDERKYYEEDAGENRLSLYGHFTQLVWKQSTKMAVAFATKGDALPSKYAIVMHFSPAGNIIGEMQENVMPLKQNNNKDVVPSSPDVGISPPVNHDEPSVPTPPPTNRAMPPPLRRFVCRVLCDGDFCEMNLTAGHGRR